MIKIAKLISGEFVVGNQLDTNLTNVVLIRFDIDRVSGTVSTSLIPYMAPVLNVAAKLITFDKIMVMEDAPPDIQQRYLITISQMMKPKEDTPNERKDNSRQNAVSREDKTKATEDK